MRALFPTPADEVDLWEAYALPRRTPFVRCNMISSIDGAIAVHGRSGMLGGPGDRRVFTVLRGLADVVLVGAATVRAEGYGPARPDEAAQAGRVGRGQQPVPPIAVITRSGQLDWSSPFFVEAAVRPILLTSADADPRELERARPVADVIVAGDDRVDLRRGIAELNGRGYASVLVEGGPGINAQL
ncbi:MAG TPA: dihydrofolate reductase family protein, partial [Acidimicrobiales bacterium]|nr:dihydrofolate reductase family protein [Acidimicrobiales bacterium]